MLQESARSKLVRTAPLGPVLCTISLAPCGAQCSMGWANAPGTQSRPGCLSGDVRVGTHSLDHHAVTLAPSSEFAQPLEQVHQVRTGSGTYSRLFFDTSLVESAEPGAAIHYIP